MQTPKVEARHLSVHGVSSLTVILTMALHACRRLPRERSRDAQHAPLSCCDRSGGSLSSVTSDEKLLQQYDPACSETVAETFGLLNLALCVDSRITNAMLAVRIAPNSASYSLKIPMIRSARNNECLSLARSSNRIPQATLISQTNLSVILFGLNSSPQIASPRCCLASLLIDQEPNESWR